MKNITTIIQNDQELGNANGLPVKIVSGGGGGSGGGDFGPFTGGVTSGQLPNAKGTLLTAAAATEVYVQFIHAELGTTSGETVVFFHKKAAGISKRLGTAVLAVAGDGFDCGDKGVILEAGDTIEGQTTTAATVDYIISRLIRDIS